MLPFLLSRKCIIINALQWHFEKGYQCYLFPKPPLTHGGLYKRMDNIHYLLLVTLLFWRSWSQPNCSVLISVFWLGFCTYFAPILHKVIFGIWNTFLSYWRVREKLVGIAGFEPATPDTPWQCATRLRYMPTCKQLYKINLKRQQPVGLFEHFVFFVTCLLPLATSFVFK